MNHALVNLAFGVLVHATLPPPEACPPAYLPWYTLSPIGPEFYHRGSYPRQFLDTLLAQARIQVGALRPWLPRRAGAESALALAPFKSLWVPLSEIHVSPAPVNFKTPHSYATG